MTPSGDTKANAADLANAQIAPGPETNSGEPKETLLPTPLPIIRNQPKSSPTSTTSAKWEHIVHCGSYEAEPPAVAGSDAQRSVASECSNEGRRSSSESTWTCWYLRACTSSAEKRYKFFCLGGGRRKPRHPNQEGWRNQPHHHPRLRPFQVRSPIHKQTPNAKEGGPPTPVPCPHCGKKQVLRWTLHPHEKLTQIPRMTMVVVGVTGILIRLLVPSGVGILL